MNYYEHHIGDYAEATAHLSFVEDAAYSRLIRKYYAIEKPLPADLKAVQRLVAARTKEEKDAVETILDEFFVLRADGWHNERCDEEIARFKDKQAKAKRSAEARWNKHQTHSDGNANASPDAMRSHSEGNAHQSPDTRHHVNPSEQPPQYTQPELAPGAAELAAEIPDPPSSEGHWLTWFNREAGTQFDPSSRFDRNDLWPIFSRWCKAGVTQQQMRDAIRRAFETATEPIASLPKYVDRVLANNQRPAAEQKKSAGQKTAEAAQRWLESQGVKS